MLSQSEEQALSQIRSYLRAGYSLTEIRESGWEDWIVHFEQNGVSFAAHEPPASLLPANAEAESAEETDTPRRQPATQDGTQEALSQIAAPASPSPDPKYAKTNASSVSASCRSSAALASSRSNAATSATKCRSARWTRKEGGRARPPQTAKQPPARAHQPG